MIDIHKKAAKEFAERWKGKGYEKGHSQPFWLDLLQQVFDIEIPSSFISFEGKVKLNNTSFIDGYISKTKVLIEQKSIDKDLRKPIKQSDGSFLTPFQQAKRYASEMKHSEQPRWIVVCNFKSFLIYDMEQPHGEPFELLLENLEREYNRLSFLVSNGPTHLKQEKELSFQAGELIGKLYNALLPQYHDPTSANALHSLNVLCVRLVFCLYSEDAGLFGTNHSAFYDYLKPFDVLHSREALRNLFKVLDTPYEKRDPYLLSPLKDFPYVNGGLFHDDIEIPNFTNKILNILLEQCSSDFNWSLISPTIFGAVFESTLNPATRDSSAMHYTSIENIHKVIDPLFLNDITDEFNRLKKIPTIKTKKQALSDFQVKLASLKFMDPACGSGNFLTETYLSLRRIENEIISILYDCETPILNLGDPIKISISQFFGIEINDFAVSVASTALWIAEAQMWNATENIVQFNGEFLPLSNNNNIHNKNAFDCDWSKDIINEEELDYIIGNPPFIGARLMSQEQKADKVKVFGEDWKMRDDLDYVSCWFYQSLKIMNRALEKDHVIKTGLVATNSITQGVQVAYLWEPLFNNGLVIDFAYHSFRWDSEASAKAHVHCVIVGFSAFDNHRPKTIYIDDQTTQAADIINGYLQPETRVSIGCRANRIMPSSPFMQLGNKAIDNKGKLSKYSTEEKDAIIKDYPSAKELFKRCYGTDEYLDNRERWCIWLNGVPFKTYSLIKPIIDAIEDVKKFRQNSQRSQTIKLAEYPALFGEIRQPQSKYLIVPLVNTEKRVYVPMDFFDKDIICTHQLGVIENASMYHFGVLQSIIHMIWMRYVCGRLEMRTRYSVKLVYNNFPWPSPSQAQVDKIEKTASAILETRKKYKDTWSISDLYGEHMPKDLKKAHIDNDKAVMAAYGLSTKSFSEEKCISKLFSLYKSLVNI